MNLEDIVRYNVENGYDLIDARAKTAQDVILNQISKSKFKNSITIKGGVVMHSISNSIRRATRDLDLDFIKYSLEDKSIMSFIDELNFEDDITIEIVGKIEELHHQDYNGKRIYIRISDASHYVIDTKLDIGVHKLFELEQDDYCFNLDGIGDGVTLFINSLEQIFTEKLKSLLKLGVRSARYKDLFDFYYLISSNQLDVKRLLKVFQVIIFDDDNMLEKTVENIYSRLKHIFNSRVYKRNLTNPKDNWLDIPINDAIDKVLNYIEELSKETIGV